MSRNQIQKLYDSCEVLPLKLFFKVAETSDFNLLVINGEYEDVFLSELWEDIIKEYADLDNNMSLNNTLDKREELFKEAAMFCEVKAMLLYLAGAYKQEYVDRLNELGYKIDEKDIIKSLKQNDQKSNHISTKMKMIQADIDGSNSPKKSTFDSTMSWLASELKFEPNENITVLRYLEYKKRIKERKPKAA